MLSEFYDYKFIKVKKIEFKVNFIYNLLYIYSCFMESQLSVKYFPGIIKGEFQFFVLINQMEH